MPVNNVFDAIDTYLITSIIDLTDEQRADLANRIILSIEDPACLRDLVRCRDNATTIIAEMASNRVR